MTDYDTRQFQLMLQKLDAFDKNALTLGKLISSLDGLINVLKNVEPQWKDAILRQWGVLEDVHADALDRNSTMISGQQKDLMKRAIEQIKQLITQKI